MPREIALMGIYFPSLLAAFVITMPVYWIIDGLLAKAGLYGWVWHVDLFRFSLFVVMFGSLGARLYR